MTVDSILKAGAYAIQDLMDVANHPKRPRQPEKERGRTRSQSLVTRATSGFRSLSRRRSRRRTSRSRKRALDDIYGDYRKKSPQNSESSISTREKIKRIISNFKAPEVSRRGFVLRGLSPDGSVNHARDSLERVRGRERNISPRSEGRRLVKHSSSRSRSGARRRKTSRHSSNTDKPHRSSRRRPSKPREDEFTRPIVLKGQIPPIPPIHSRFSAMSRSSSTTSAAPGSKVDGSDWGGIPRNSSQSLENQNRPTRSNSVQTKDSRGRNTEPRSEQTARVKSPAQRRPQQEQGANSAQQPQRRDSAREQTQTEPETRRGLDHPAWEKIVALDKQKRQAEADRKSRDAAAAAAESQRRRQSAPERQVAQARPPIPARQPIPQNPLPALPKTAPVTRALESLQRRLSSSGNSRRQPTRSNSAPITPSKPRKELPTQLTADNLRQHGEGYEPDIQVSTLNRGLGNMARTYIEGFATVEEEEEEDKKRDIGSD